MLNVIVLIAMAVTAAAFAAGLILQAGLPLLPVLIGTAALFLVMATSFFAIGRGRKGGGGDRIDEFEEALEIIDRDLQRLHKVEDGISRIEDLSDKVDQLDQAVSGGVLGEAGSGGASVAADLQDVYAGIEAVRTEVVSENRTQRLKIAEDLGALEGLIKSISVEMAASGQAAPVSALALSSVSPETEAVADDKPEPEPVAASFLETEQVLELAPEVALEPEVRPEAELVLVEEETSLDPHPERAPEPEEELVLEMEPEVAIEPAGEPDVPDDVLEREDVLLAAATSAEETPEPAAAEAPASFMDDDDDDAAMLEIVREGIELGRVDLYLQPTVILPDRKVRYFEALTRMRKADDGQVKPRDYMPVAKRSALMPLIDNVLVVRSVQVLRRLGPDAPIKGVFANISMHSLLDPDYYPELIEFMEENNGLSESLIFEINQSEMQGLTESELGCLDTLGALGFTFCLDTIGETDADFAGLSERYFHYVKAGAESFLGGPGRNAVDVKQRLDGLGMQLIVKKVEKESDIAELLDHGIVLAQGQLFGDAQPMNVALSGELENASAT